MSSHIQLRGKTYYARLNVPQDLRSIWGKAELIQSLKTSDRKVADARAMIVVGQWKQEFAQLRSSDLGLDMQAVQLRIDEDTSPVNEQTGMSAKDYYLEHLAEQLPEKEELRFRQIASTKLTPFGLLLDDYLTQWDVEPKTKAMARTAIRRVAEELIYVEQASYRRVEELVRTDTKTSGTKRKNYGFVAQYWNYLQKRNVIQGRDNPFAGLKFKEKVAHGGARRKAFDTPHILELHRQAQLAEDTDIASLILIGAYTGARIEEICSLKVDDVKYVDGRVCIHITDSKTKAGVRVVPAHQRVARLLDSLCRQSLDGYVLSGLSADKYGNRSNAIGKRFGRLKTRLGFGDDYVFHSIRKTVITVFENLGVNEGLTADIVGHEKKTITYGLYSAGHSLKNKAVAIDLLEFDFK
jgi:integrase